MNEFIKKLTDDMKSADMKSTDMKNNPIKIDKKDYEDIISYSDSYMEIDAFPKLALTAINYLIEMETKDAIINDLKAKLQYYEKGYSILAHTKQVPYAEDMKQRKENGFYPADKHIPYKTVKKLDEMGFSKTQIAEKLGISRSTVYRKLKEAQEQGYSGKIEISKRLNL